MNGLKKIPPTVIVGLPRTTESRWKYYTPTNQQYKGETNFVNKELIPEVSTKLKANFMSKTFFGHSNGGLGAMSFYVLNPEIFNNYIIARPATHWDSYYLQRKLRTQTGANPTYMTLGAKADYKVDYLTKLKDKLKSTNNNFRFVLNDQEEHPTNGLRTLLDGLKYVYSVNPH